MAIYISLIYSSDYQLTGHLRDIVREPGGVNLPTPRRKVRGVFLIIIIILGLGHLDLSLVFQSEIASDYCGFIST